MRLRLLSYNIHKCIGGVDRRYRPDRILTVIAHYGPDLLLLQEVDEGVRRSRRHSQAQLLADALGFEHRAFYPNVRVRGGGVYGNAVLSRYPIRATRNISLTFPLRKRRSALYAALHIPAGHGHKEHQMHVFNLHLGLSGLERRWQLARLLAHHPLRDVPPREPVLVAGDFNDVWGTLGGAVLAPAGFRGQAQPLRTFPAWAPVRALDAVYVRGDVRLHHVYRSHLREASLASDHLPLFAEVELH